MLAVDYFPKNSRNVFSLKSAVKIVAFGICLAVVFSVMIFEARTHSPAEVLNDCFFWLMATLCSLGLLGMYMERSGGGSAIRITDDGIVLHIKKRDKLIPWGEIVGAKSGLKAREKGKMLYALSGGYEVSVFLRKDLFKGLGVVRYLGLLSFVSASEIRMNERTWKRDDLEKIAAEIERMANPPQGAASDDKI